MKYLTHMKLKMKKKQMKKFIRNLFKGKKQQCNIPDVNVSVAATCSTCRFVDRERDMCTVGSYWAEKGQNKVCYSGELWEAIER